MADYQQIIEQIRGFLQASDQTRNERLESLASTYAEACADVNQRLGRCQRLLQQGLRSEAIQLAESEPRLLGAIATLDFPERKEWDELVEIYSLAGAPKLVVEARSALNDAYAEAEPLENLLRTHRRLATQRAALRMRIGVMRKLASKDARNPIWIEDLRAFEKARFRQIQAEAAEAARLQDSAHLARLLSEVQEPAWIEPPPKSLVQGLAKADTQLRREQARTALAEIEARLSDALTAGDPIRGRTARDDWTKLTASVPVEPGDPCLVRIGPALQWLEEEDRRAVATVAYDADLAALSDALDDRRAISAAELERLEGTVLRHGRGMPDKLQRRYATRFRSAATVRSRRVRVIVAAAIAVVVLLGGSAFYAVRANGRTRAAEEAAATVAGLVEKRDFEQAEVFLENLEKADASLLAHPVLLEARKRSKTARNEETERARKFDDAMQEAQGAPLDEIEPKALSEARTLAQLDAENRAVTHLSQQREAARKQGNEKRDAGLLARLEAIIREIDQLGMKLDATPLDIPRMQEELDHLRLSIDKLKPELALSGTDPQRVAEDLKRKLETVTSRIETLRHQSRLKDEITSAVAFSVTEESDNLTRFGRRLHEFAEANPGDPCSAVFQETLKEQSLWDAVAAWNGLVGPWRKKRAALTRREAELRENACGEFLAKYPGFAGNKDVQDYRRYLQPIARRYSGDKSPAGSLKGLFSHSLVEDTWMVKLKPRAGRQYPDRFYPRKPPVKSGRDLLFEILREGMPVVRSIPLESIETSDPSPQSVIARKFAPLFNDPLLMERSGGWESNTIDLVRTIINDRDMGAVVQLILLKSVVKAGGEGSEPIRVSLKSVRDQIESADVDLSVDLTNPDARNLDESQTGALEVIERLRKEMPTGAQVSSERDRLERAVRQTYRTTGWLIRSGNGYEVRRGAAVPGDGDLWVIVPGAEKGAKWQKVGAIANGKLTLDMSDKSALAEGRPVFVIVKNY